MKSSGVLGWFSTSERFAGSRTRIHFVIRISCIGSVLAVSASAQVLRPIDIRQRADANDKTVEMPTVSFGTVTEPTRPQPVSPLSGQVREPAGTIETKRVDFKTL